MNDTPRTEPADLARLLPPPAVPDLSADRHRQLKDTFMDTITQTSDTLTPAGERGPRPARRRWTLVAAGGAVAAVAIGAVALGRPAVDNAPPDTAPAMVAVDPGSAAGVGSLVDRLARAAARRPDVPVGSGQFVYVRSKIAWTNLGDPSKNEKARLDEVHDREVWLPQSAGRDGLIRERGEKIGLHGQSNSRYDELPTDPDALLQRIYMSTGGTGYTPEDAAFSFISEALGEALLPPDLTAALFRAAAKIPGVVEVKNSVDAVGRHGVALGRTDKVGERREWIFDPQTLEFLGERAYLVRDTEVGKAGMLTGTTAILQRGVVNKPGDLPE
jgi:hypothetical protein